MLRRNIHSNVQQKKIKGQSTVEYIVLAAAVIAAIIFFVVGANSPFRQAYNRTLISGTNGMEEMANRLATSRPKCKGTNCVF